jgi:hypothetical protein
VKQLKVSKAKRVRIEEPTQPEVVKPKVEVPSVSQADQKDMGTGINLGLLTAGFFIGAGVAFRGMSQ